MFSEKYLITQTNTLDIGYDFVYMWGYVKKKIDLNFVRRWPTG